MGLPASYFEYAHRSYGMDHNRYEWSALPTRRRVSWPGDSKVAVWVSVALEFYPLNQPQEPFRAPGGMVTPYPDLRHYSLRDYGNRVGAFRVFDVLDELGIQASVPMNAKVAQRYPALLEEVCRRNWEVIANGIDMGTLHHEGLCRDEEEGYVEEALATLRSASGQDVAGWLSPARSESSSTLDLVAKHGIEYVCDWANDDMPYAINTEHGELYSMPMTADLDDRQVIFDHRQTEHQFTEQVLDALKFLRQEADTQGGRVLSIVIHPWVSGQPHRIQALRSTLNAVSSTSGVWVATGTEILQAFLEATSARHQ